LLGKWICANFQFIGLNLFKVVVKSLKKNKESFAGKALSATGDRLDGELDYERIGSFFPSAAFITPNLQG
jgi:hypothetical protein